MKTNVLLSFFFFAAVFANAQNTLIKPGVVLPQMTTAQRTAVSSPNGILVFDSNTQSYWFLQNGVWTELPKAISNTNSWQQAGLGGNEIQNTNSGGFWSANPTGLTNDSTNPPTAPTSGAGTRMMWIPSRSAFRVGTVYLNPNAWNASNIGLFSFASGIDTQANGHSSTAMGVATQANGDYSTAMGFATQANGDYSTAMGFATNASVYYSTAMGSSTTASGYYSTAMGSSTTASGKNSTSMGVGTNASGEASTAIGSATLASGFNSTAIGYAITASGNTSTAMGYGVSTNLQQGAFAIGDSDPTGEGTALVGGANQFMARFYNGYFLMTSGFVNRFGVAIGHNQTAWSSISDSTKKEKFIAANGEDFLVKLRQLQLGSWNYKLNEKNPERFYGPMAQEIFAAYGKDKLGKIGTDTTVSTINMDGILFIFAQALEKRTRILQEENAKLKSQMADIQQVMSRIEKLEALLNDKEKVQVSGK